MIAVFVCRRALVLALVTMCGAIHLKAPSGPGNATVVYVEKRRSVTRWGFVNDASATEAEDLVASITAEGVWMTKSHSLKSAQVQKTRAISLVKYTAKYGFYMHTYSDGEAVIHLLREVRRVYPGEPIYIMSDGGKNFSGLCNELGNCEFAWKPPANDRWNPVPFFLRFKEAARWLKTKFIIMLEPDNELRFKIKTEPQFDAGGLNDSNPEFSDELMKYVESKGQKYTGDKNFTVAWKRFGLAGGSYFSTAAVLEAFNPEDLDWHKLRQLDDKRVFSSDVAMPMALACHGYTYYPWSEVTQERFGLKDTAALRHYGRDEVKPHYGEALSKVDKTTLVTDDTPAHVDVTCQGCVWFSDETCLKHKPIKCNTTGHDMGPPTPWHFE